MDNTTMDYNTGRAPMKMPEYGRNVIKMVERLKTIEDRDKRSQQARAVIKTMEILNPSVRSQENWEQKLWDSLFIIAGFDLDIDAPYPCPVPEQFETRPVPIPMKGEKMKAAHYGKNIEKIINLLCDEPDGEVKSAMIHALATYMRQQYLIWNKDNVADETIFADLEKLADGRIKVPEGMSLAKISEDASFSRPGLGNGENGQGRNRNRRHGGRHQNNRKK